MIYGRKETVGDSNGLDFVRRKALVNASEPCKDALCWSQRMQVIMQVALA